MQYCFETSQQCLYVKKKVFHSHLMISYIDSELFRSFFRLKIASAVYENNEKRNCPHSKVLKSVRNDSFLAMYIVRNII